MDIVCLEEEVKNALKERTSKGETEREIAKASGVSNGHINSLKNGRRKISGLSLGCFLKMFPQATISLHGDQINAPIIHTGNNCKSVIGVNHGTCQYTEEDCEKRLIRIKDKIMASDIPPEAKEKVYNIINSVQ